MPKINQPTPVSGLADKLKNVKMPAARKVPVWDGPEDPGPGGGITQSLLVRFLSCRERFRLKVCEGFRTVDSFSHRLEFGNYWHVCEEALASNQDWEEALTGYGRELLQKYPLQRQQVEHWYEVCRLQFPHYVEHWSKHPDVVNRTPIFQEQVFHVPYKLPSGRTVWLRGKYDSVDLIGQGKDVGIYLQENKTKSEIDRQEIERQLRGDLQSMFYLTALSITWKDGDIGYENESHMVSDHPPHPIRGIRYNMIRRPLSGGKGQIKQHEGKPSEDCPNCSGTGRTPKLSKVCSRCKGSGRTEPVAAETKEHFYGRVEQYIKDEPETYFMRWQADVQPRDIERFQRRVLDPILEQLCLWWDWISSDVGKKHPFENPIHWQHPFGVKNSVDEYGHGDLDAYLETGNEAGLQRVEELFPELKEPL